MAKTLNLVVVAEGIETQEQAGYFALYDQPILGQGWLFGHPVTVKDFCRILAENEERASLLVPPGQEV
jgi:sensor c-di-GMP phosphodiesterase-like protein